MRPMKIETAGRGLAALRRSTAVPLALAVVAMAATSGGFMLATSAPAVATTHETNPCAADNPCAASCEAANPCAASCEAANPCAADSCAADNPCAANPCASENPCAADNPCGPCGPCEAAGSSGKTECVLPSATCAAANPCAADNPCGPCAADNPCEAANPCAASCEAANPCAASCEAANPCAASCEAAANPCAASCEAANPCAADNPCGPCAAACAADDAVMEVSDEDAAALYDCLVDMMETQAAALDSGEGIDGPSWLLSDAPEASAFLSWENVTTAPYISATHAERYVVNLADPAAAPTYREFEDGGAMPTGGILAKPSFTVSGDGHAVLGPLFLMEKAEDGAFPETGDWIYSAIQPDGSLMGRTGGMNGDGMQFCADCHMGIGAETDSMTYLPDEYRVSN